jgi:starch synthase
VASEAIPFAKEGGLADVTGALSRELHRMGHDVRVVIPRYYKIDKEQYGLKQVGGVLSVPMGIIGDMDCAALEGKMPGTEMPVYFIEHDQFFGRDGGFYSNKEGVGYIDNDNRMVFLSRASLELCRMIDFRPDVIHANDWHTAAVPVFLNTVYRHDGVIGAAASVLTIHNIQHQGQFYEGLMDVLGIGWEHFNWLELEKDRETNLLKGGIYHSNVITTVSESYAGEIQTPEFGFGLDGVLRERASDLHGILNGVDYDEWTPEKDTFIAKNYSEDDMEGKAACKADLQRSVGLPVNPGVPIIGLVTRLVKQKGVDVLAEVMCSLLNYEAQIVLLGSGEVWAHFYFGDLPAKHPDKFACYIGYDNALAHKIEAGADFFLMPSLFEPCGLNQMYSLRYGTLPIARATGGLNDTIENFDEATLEGTGFKFYDLNSKALLNTIGWALHTYYNRNDAMQTLIRRAMQKRFTWADSARLYEELYIQAVKKRLGDEEFSKRFG